MNKEIKEQWIEKLRSGKYKQGKGRLKNAGEGEYCCLGVLADIYVQKQVCEWKQLDEDVTALETIIIIDGEKHSSLYDTHLPVSILDQIWLSLETEGILAEMNDRYNMSFSEIANWIEANL